jgi:hypothetical protein
MVTKRELDRIVQILHKKCNLCCTNDPATNVMTYSQWLDYILSIVNTDIQIVSKKKGFKKDLRHN